MSVDYYHDDPEFLDEPKKSYRFGKLFASLIFLTCGGLFIQTTLASNISLNSNNNIEFGQAVSRTIACDSNGLTVTASAGFVNAQGGGSYVLGSIKVSGVDAVAGVPSLRKWQQVSTTSAEMSCRMSCRMRKDNPMITVRMALPRK